MTANGALRSFAMPSFAATREIYISTCNALLESTGRAWSLPAFCLFNMRLAVMLVGHPVWRFVTID